MDFILAGPPPHDGPYAWKKEAVDDWAKSALAWVRAYCPDAPVAAAAVHWDERSPHMHLLLAPIVREGGKVRLGIKAIRQRLASGVEAPRRKRGQHRDELSAVQDAYHEHVARRFGLRRGNTQSTARHVKVDALEGAQRRLHDLRGSVEHYDRAMDSVLEQRRDLNGAVAELRHEQARLRGSREVDEREAGLAQVRRETAERAAREAEEERKRAEGFSRRLVVGRQAHKGKARREELEQRVEELQQARDALDGEASALRTRVNGLEVRAMSAEARNAAADAALVSRDLADRLWPPGAAVGQRFRMRPLNDGDWLTVVGVAGSVRTNASGGLERPDPYEIYLPWATRAGTWRQPRFVLVRTAQGADPIGLLKEQVWRLDPALPVTVHAMDDVVAATLAQPRFLTTLLAAFALLAMLLAAAGLYAVVAYETSARTQEIGVRVALGATRGAVVRQVLGRSLLHSAAGAALGLLGAVALIPLSAPLPSATTATDSATFAAAAAFLLTAAIAGAWLPARRAARTDPMAALRAE